jgi:PBSX family phage terminase large subunit
MPFSDKQIDFLKNSTYDINICSGSVRSGKTFISNLRLYDFLENEAINNVDVLISGKKGDSVERNVVNPFLDIMDINGCKDRFHYQKNPRVLKYLPKNIDCIIEGANDVGAEGKIRGMTSQAWLADEITIYPKNFVLQAINRCSAGKRYKWWTTNPDSPSHYIKTDIIDKIESGKVDGRVWYWNIDTDNPILDRAYIKQIKSLHNGIFYDRFILGKWVIAEGCIYDTFNRDKHIVESYPVKEVKEYILGIDWGYAKDHPMAILLMAVTNDAYYVIDEIYLEGQLVDKSLRGIMETKGWYSMPDLDYDPETFFSPARKKTKTVSYAYADSARPDMIDQFRKISGISTLPAVKHVTDGIQAVQRLFTLKDNGKYGIYILSKCVNTIRELELYRWDSKLSTGEGKDIPVKKDDHCPDAIRYAVFTRGAGMARQVKDFRVN